MPWCVRVRVPSTNSPCRVKPGNWWTPATRLAWLEQGAGQFDASITHYQHVLPLQQAAFGADDDDSLESQRGLAAAYARTDRFAEAEPAGQSGTR